METWKPIPSWEGYFEVSDQGRVRSLDRTITTSRGLWTVQGRIRRHYVRPTGYWTIGLKGMNRYEQVDIHLLVLAAFVGPRPDGAVARHLNGNPADNRPENLCWGTHSENNFDQVRHGTHPEAGKTHCVNGHPFSGDNLKMVGRKRICKQCTRDSTRRYVKRKQLRADAS